MRLEVTRQQVNTGMHAQRNFTRMSHGILDLGPSGYRNDHKKKPDRFPCRKSDLSSEFHAWKNTYLEEDKKKSTHSQTWLFRWLDLRTRQKLSLENKPAECTLLGGLLSFLSSPALKV